MKKDYSAAELISAADIGHLRTIGLYFAKSAKVLYELKKPEHSYAFHLLVSQAVEILPKSVIAEQICLNKKDCREEEIFSGIQIELVSLGHSFDEIFNKIPQLKERLNISSIDRLNETGFVDEYRFKLENPPREFSIKNLEAVRYGALAKKKDIFLHVEGDNYIVEFLDHLVKEILELSREICIKIKEE
jgi:hypothetical protein